MKTPVFLLFLLFSLNIAADPLDDIWKALESKDWKLTDQLISKSMKNPQTRMSASLIKVLLEELEGNENTFRIFEDAISDMSDPSPYIFAHWLEGAVTNGYENKDTERLKYLKKLLKTESIHPTITGSGNYILGHHHQSLNDMAEARKYWDKIQSIKNWQFTGTFDNRSGSGFENDYGPISNPKPDAVFKSQLNSDIRWYEPAYLPYDPWVSTHDYFDDRSGIIFAQTFVEVSEESEVLLAIGMSGNLKVWVNDGLVISSEHEYRTDMDQLVVPVRLNKGYNRLLVQLGYTDETEYPNFMMRFYDKDFQLISGRFNVSPSYQPYKKAEKTELTPAMPHFAESFFEKKIKENPDDVLNHLKLAMVYRRSKKFNEAIKVLKKGLEMYPQNILMNKELMLCYMNLSNRTEMLKQLEFIRSLKPNTLFLLIYDFNQELELENYAEAHEKLALVGDILGKESDTYYDMYIKLAANERKVQELYGAIQDAFSKYPDESLFLNYMFRLLKNQGDTSDKAYGIIEEYLKNHFDYPVLTMLFNEYVYLGRKKEAEKLLTNVLENYPGDLTTVNMLMNFYYKKEDYKKALQYTDMALTCSPFNSGLWKSRAYIHEALNKKELAKEDFKQTIHFNPNSFEAREKLRDLEGKKAILSYFEKENATDIILEEINQPYKSDENFRYIYKESNHVIFPEGASMQFTNIAVQVLNDAGIDHWKESYISYNSYWENLFIVKAQVIKANGQKVAAERNYNDLVFPSLEKGDAIHIEYRKEFYTAGKLAKEFWLNHIFNSFYPVDNSVFRFWVPKGQEFHIKYRNTAQEPEKSNIDDFDCYQWVLENPKQCKGENYMPTLLKSGMVVSISSVESWDVIADWYHDLAMPRAKSDYNIDRVYQELFEGKENADEMEKARIIYDYICENIEYSSVSFLQSSYVPKKPMMTVSSRLGDCKDVSTLYYTLAEMAGLSTNLVLVRTRDLGEESLPLPSNSFNHCIVRINFENREPLFQELTNQRLPFGAITANLENAQALVIPNSDNPDEKMDLININFKPLTQNTSSRKLDIMIKDRHADVTTRLEIDGAPTAGFRSYFSGMNNDQLRETIIDYYNDDFEGSLSLNDFDFNDLDGRGDKFIFNSNFEVENVVKSIGGFKAIKPPFVEKIISLNNFPDEPRSHELQYWEYEDMESYYTEIVVEIPEGQAWMDLPENVNIDEFFMNYSLTFEKIDNRKLKITRSADLKRINIPAEKYQAFRDVIREVVAAEDVYLAFK
ncbi:MAG: DUF3857 domain-containing protein [Bacteroidota bacterium]